MNIKQIVIAALSLVAATACYNRFEAPSEESSLQAATTDIAALRSLATSKVERIDEPMVVSGRVTSSDEEGNFYLSFFIEDATGAAEILAGIYNLHSSYPRGVEVSVSLQGCAIMLDDGVLKIGLPDATNAYEPAELLSPALLGKHVGRGTAIVEPQPRCVTIESLCEAMCGMLIEVEALRYEPIGDETLTMAGYKRFVDGAGHEIYCSTSEYAEFADRTIPSGEVTLRGILLYENVGNHVGKKWVIKPIAWSDIACYDALSAVIVQ